MKRGWLIAALFAALAAWTSVDAGSSPFEDGPYLLGVSMQIAIEMREGWLGESLTHLASVVAPQPAGAYALPTLLYSIFGPSPAVPLLASWICLLACYDGMARMIRTLWPMESRWWWPVVAWGSLAGCALVVQTTEQAAVDLTLAALLVQGTSWLTASAGLTRRRESVLAGVCFGLTVLLKYSAPVLLLPIFALVIVKALWRRLSGHLIDLMGLTIAVAAPFYLWNRPWILDYLSGSLPAGEAGFPGMDRWLFYPAVAVEAVGWPGFLLGIAGLLMAMRSPGRETRDLLLAGGLGGHGLLAFLELRHPADPLIPTLARPEYALPCLFLLATLAVPPLLRHIHGRWAIVAFVALQAMATLVAYGQERSGESLPRGVIASERLTELHWPMPGPSSIPPGPLPNAEVWEELAWNTASELPSGTLGVVFDDAFDSAQSIGRLLYESGRVETRWDLAQIEPDRVVLIPFPSRTVPPEEPKYRQVLAITVRPPELEGEWIEVGRWPVFTKRDAVLYEVR